ncbi:hypothetical protein ACRRTK_010605 [Alexandromys fortis]
MKHAGYSDVDTSSLRVVHGVQLGTSCSPLPPMFPLPSLGPEPQGKFFPATPTLGTSSGNEGRAQNWAGFI